MRHGAMAVLAAVLAVGLVGCEPTKTGATGGMAAKAAKVAIRVNTGDDKPYTDSSGTAWLPDQEYKEGAKYGAIGGRTVVRTGLKIAGAKDPQLYLTERYGMTGYRFDVPNGKYTVKLHFCETYDGITAAGGRIFAVSIQGRPVAVSIQGKPVLVDFDVFKDAGGFAKPIVKEYKNVEVTDGKLMIEFTPKVQSPEINALEVLGQ